MTSDLKLPYAALRKALLNMESTKTLARYLPAKREVYRAIRSKQYARDHYEILENIGAFVYIAELILKMESTGAVDAEDIAEVKLWLETRESRTIHIEHRTLADVDFSDFINRKQG